MNTAKDKPETRADLAPSAYMVMAMIRDGFDTGYRIKQFIERAASFFWSVSYGQIYPELRRLEGAGLITGRDVTSSGRRRREYSLTAAGAKQLERWLADPAEPSMWLRNEGLLRLMLVDWDADPELVRKNLGELRQMSAERLETITGLVPPRERGRRIQELGVRLLTETVAWCDDTEAGLPPPDQD
ncbi:MAG TPA: PadR family transcriptional regulator [Solirubrobacterales bacterium]|jgi:DNA-binding PadR family transcriptional regulator